MGAIATYYGSSSPHYYAHPDWLGSIRVSSTSARVLSQDESFAPFGEEYQISGCCTTSQSGDVWTGQHRNNVVAGLWDFPMREYFNNQGRWMSPDPAGLAAVDPTNPQTWNRYAYVGGTPLSAIDPLGLASPQCTNSTAGCGGNTAGGNVPLGSTWNEFWAMGVPVTAYKWGPIPEQFWNSPTNPGMSYRILGENGWIPIEVGTGFELLSSLPLNNFNWGWNFTKAFLRSLVSSGGWKSVYRSFGEGGCDRLMAETFAESFNPIRPDAAGTALDLGPKGVAGAGQVSASAYSAYQGLSVPLRSSVYRGLQSSTYGYAAAFEEAAPYLQVGYAGGNAVYTAGSAAYNGECQ